MKLKHQIINVKRIQGITSSVYVRATNCEKNFLGYELDGNDRLVKNKTYGGNSGWPDLLLQVNKLKGCVIYEDNLAKVVVNGKKT